MKNRFIVMIASTLLVLGGCSSGNNDATNSANVKSADKVVAESAPLSPDEFNQMFSDPKKFKGRVVEFSGRIFTDPEVDKDGIYLQVWADPKKSEKNVLVGFPDNTLAVETNDYVTVHGTVKDSFEGENAFGGKVTAPVISADNVEKADYVTAVSPALKKIDVNKTIDQNGYQITLQKIEIAESETRLYVKVKNDSEDKISFYDFNTNLIQGSKQFEVESNYEADYPEIQSDILPGVETDGIIPFPAINANGEDLKILAEGSSENWDVKFSPFEWTVSLK